MKKRNPSSYSLDDLRKRAEVFLTRNPSGGDESFLEDIHDLFEDLRIHQVELEMQDQELRRAYEELEKIKEPYWDLYDFAPVGYLTLDENNLISRVNVTGAELLGIERRRLIGNQFTRFISPGWVDHFYHHRSECLDTGKRQSCELKLQSDAEDDRYIQLVSQTVPDDEGNFSRIRIAMIDITHRKKGEEQIRILSQELLGAHEKERQMISCELHDRIAQDLSAVKMGCDTFLEGYLEIPAEMRQRASELSRIIQGVIMAVRDLSYELRPPDMEKTNMIELAGNLCREFSHKTGIKLDFLSAGMEHIKLDDLVLINIYRIIQEGLHNIHKHAHASHVNVTVSYSHPYILIRIVDNGKGFDVEKRLAAITSERRMGLRSMEERTRLLGGTMTIQSRPMRGTRVFIRLSSGERANG